MRYNLSWENSLSFPKPKFIRQIVMVWVSVLIAIFMYALAYYTIGRVALTFIDAVTNSVSFESPWSDIVTLVKNVVYYHPLIALFGWLLWGFLNSMRRDVRTWEA